MAFFGRVEVDRGTDGILPAGENRNKAGQREMNVEIWCLLRIAASEAVE
jgi:hypothetical protein